MSDDALLREDAESRQRALGADSCIVEAPAGAGKTELLAQRFLKLLAQVESPEEIVALTFTNKAAAEMRHRIMDNLAAAAAGTMPGEPHKAVSHELALAALEASRRHGWGLLDHPGRLRVTTIDALCASLARQMPVLSRFGAEPRLADDAGRHYEEAARRALAWLEEDGPHAQAVERALRHLDNDAQRLAELLAAMLARRDQWLRHTLESQPWRDAERALAALVQTELDRVSRAFPAAVQEALMPVARYATGNLADDHALAVLRDWSLPLRADAEELPLWRGLAALLLTNEGTPRRKLDKRDGFPPKESDAQKKTLLAIIAGLSGEAVAALAETRQLPDPHYTPEEWATVEALGNLLRLAAAELWTVFNETGEADFVEVALRARQALGDEAQPTDLALALDYRIRHLLVDEFQDTSPTQAELLQRLTAGWQAGDGRTLFLVGDPMQSIYRFRKADVGLFIAVKERGFGDLAMVPLRLYRNNRSQRPVVDWVNDTFAQVFAPADDIPCGAIRYRESAATKEENENSGVTAHALVVAKGGDADLAEAREILAIIDAERAADPARQIAVLVRARDHLSALVREIRRHRPGLRFTAVEMERLNARQPVQDLLSLTRALLHRGDRVSWLAILRAPWCGLTLADLHALAGDDHVSTIWQLINDAQRVGKLSPDGRARLEAVAGVLGQALREQGRVSVRRWIEGTWTQLGGPVVLAGETDLADAVAYLDLLDELDAGGRLTLAQLEKETGQLYAAPDAIDENAAGILQFMTLHKAKGLQFDTVILPGLNRKTGGNDTPLMRWEEVMVEGREQLVVAPMKRRRPQADGEAKTPCDWLGRFEKRRESNEAARLLYVGATRAIRRLHWVAAVELNAKGEPKPQAGSLLELLWPVASGEFDATAPMAADVDAMAGGFDFVPQLRRLAVPQTLSLPEAAAPAAPGAASGADDTGEPLDALVGTLVHAYLEMIARDGPDAWSIERLSSLRAGMEIWLMQQGCGDRDSAQGAERAGAILQTTLASEAGRWVLQSRKEAAAELAVVKVSRGGTPIPTTSVIDRTFVEDGVRWIIDYKTATPAGDLVAHAEHYREQLVRYADLFRDEGLPIQCAIFYAALGHLVQYSGEI
jgi:ATP-dependent exoDNAse (exonuclease V) beta subunit